MHLLSPSAQQIRNRRNSKRFRQRHPGYETKYQPILTPKQRRVKKLWQKYKLLLSEYNQMVIIQGGKCAICRKIPRRLCVDHNHKTGRIRALLCDGCNLNVGFIEGRLKLFKKVKDYATSFS